MCLKLKRSKSNSNKPIKNVDNGWSYLLLLNDTWETREFSEMIAQTRDHFGRDKLKKGNCTFNGASQRERTALAARKV